MQEMHVNLKKSGFYASDDFVLSGFSTGALPQHSLNAVGDLYSMLNVSRNATSREIHTAWRHLSRALHPDKARRRALDGWDSEDDEEYSWLGIDEKNSNTMRETLTLAQQELNFVYMILSNPVKRRLYDRFGLRALAFLEKSPFAGSMSNALTVPGYEAADVVEMIGGLMQRHSTIVFENSVMCRTHAQCKIDASNIVDAFLGMGNRFVSTYIGTSSFGDEGDAEAEVQPEGDPLDFLTSPLLQIQRSSQTSKISLPTIDHVIVLNNIEFHPTEADSVTLAARGECASGGKGVGLISATWKHDFSERSSAEFTVHSAPRGGINFAMTRALDEKTSLKWGVGIRAQGLWNTAFNGNLLQIIMQHPELLNLELESTRVLDDRTTATASLGGPSGSPATFTISRHCGANKELEVEVEVALGTASLTLSHPLNTSTRVQLSFEVEGFRDPNVEELSFKPSFSTSVTTVCTLSSLTRLNVGVSIHSNNGIVFKPGIIRGGCVFSLPIVLSHEIRPSIVAGALVLPSLVALLYRKVFHPFQSKGALHWLQKSPNLTHKKRIAMWDELGFSDKDKKILKDEIVKWRKYKRNARAQQQAMRSSARKQNAHEKDLNGRIRTKFILCLDGQWSAERRNTFGKTDYINTLGDALLFLLESDGYFRGCSGVTFEERMSEMRAGGFNVFDGESKRREVEALHFSIMIDVKLPAPLHKETNGIATAINRLVADDKGNRLIATAIRLWKEKSKGQCDFDNTSIINIESSGLSGLVIQKATYGRTDGRGKVVDVTVPLQFLINSRKKSSSSKEESQLCIHGCQSKSSLVGFYDPASVERSIEKLVGEGGGGSKFSRFLRNVFSVISFPFSSNRPVRPGSRVPSSLSSTSAGFSATRSAADDEDLNLLLTVVYSWQGVLYEIQVGEFEPLELPAPHRSKVLGDAHIVNC
eukprot:g2168.t1